jgi:tetratricopeptide (TPR) repeat protein
LEVEGGTSRAPHAQSDKIRAALVLAYRAARFIGWSSLPAGGDGKYAPYDTPLMMAGRELKPLRARNLSEAVALAKHYRALNQPEDAESICRDILDVAPDNEEAWRLLGLALTDQFPTAWLTLFDEACAAFAKLRSNYERVYYTAIAWERYAKAQLVAGRVNNAIHAFEEALRRFDEADRLGSPDDPAPVLHYNRCLRALTTHPELARVSSVPPEPDYEFGD